MAYPASPNPFNSTVTVTGFSTLASPNNPPSYSQEVSEDEIPPQTSVAATGLVTSFVTPTTPKDPTVLVVDPIAFSVWMNTIISTWACKGGITILMPNPQEKVVRAEKADLVAEVVRRAEARKSLAWASTSTSQVAGHEFDIGDEDPKENPELDDF
ncbi:hypothetical protein H4Q26_013700 [Puccinia striiformis f. sp. tritici PST-130]|nr:hypothetical protein H4Q26_013700 [Puccinia striiformis f. sp. tritici PST-130]